jgi:type IV pilus assembly protein PilC
MAKFKYTAIDANGKQKTGTIEAGNQEDANSKLSAAGLMPTKVTATDRGGGGRSGAVDKGSKGKKKARGFGKVIKQEDLATFTRQLATLLQAGLPLLRGLEVMIRQEKNLRFQAVLEQIAEQVKSGNSFSDGLAQHPKIFDRLYINMVKAGEAGGVLDTVLGRLAGFMEKALKTKKKVKSAMVYPVVVVGVAFSIVALLMTVVVPKFQTIFDDMLEGAALPGPTQIVINISDTFQKVMFFTDSLLLNILIDVVIIVLFVVLMKMVMRTRPAQVAFNWLSINTPKVGELARKVNIARITRTFGTLLSSGVPILQSITISKDITGNTYYSSALNRIHDSVRDGEALAAQMERESVFPNMVTSMVDVGEETGELAEMLNRIADNYDEDVDNAVAGITSIIEPVMIVFLAVVVGFIVIALFLPIVEIIQQLTG